MGTGGQSELVEDQIESNAIEKKRRSRPLAKWMADEPRPIEELLPLMVSVLKAIAKANLPEPQFCSLSPSRILVRQYQSVQIETYGRYEPGKTFDLGDAKYTCPEFFGDAARSTPAGANAYSAGFIFYELMLGRNRFEAQFQDVQKDGNLGWLTWHADATKRAASLSEMNRYPAFACRIIDRMIEKNPTNRLTDINGIAKAFSSVSDATMVYKIVRDRSSAAASGALIDTSSDGPRPWLANLGRQKLWMSLWKHVAPNEPHLRQRSIEELERILQDIEDKSSKFRSIFSFNHSARRKSRS